MMQFCIDVDNQLANPSFEVTPSGWLRVKGAIARTGNMIYRTTEGKQFYQYVPPDTLFADDHLATIAGSPVTLDHPEDAVTPANSKQYTVGSVGDRVFANIDKGLLEVVFTIYDSAAIKAVTQDGMNQLSMGYWAELIEDTESPNTYIQTKRTTNHIALVNKARGGDALKLNLDSYCCLYYNDKRSPIIPQEKSKTEEINKCQILYVMV